MIVLTAIISSAAQSYQCVAAPFGQADAALSIKVIEVAGVARTQVIKVIHTRPVGKPAQVIAGTHIISPFVEVLIGLRAGQQSEPAEHLASPRPAALGARRVQSSLFLGQGGHDLELLSAVLTLKLIYRNRTPPVKVSIISTRNLRISQ